MNYREEKKLHRKKYTPVERLQKAAELCELNPHITRAQLALILECSVRTLTSMIKNADVILEKEATKKAKELLKPKKREWNRRGPKGASEYTTAYLRKIKYGVTSEQYKQMFDAQAGKCAICGKHQSILKRGLAVDHDHITGDVRGLLCPSCNLGLGMFKDTQDLLMSAVKYLQINEEKKSA